MVITAWQKQQADIFIFISLIRAYLLDSLHFSHICLVIALFFQQANSCLELEAVICSVCFFLFQNPNESQRKICYHGTHTNS